MTPILQFLAVTALGLFVTWLACLREKGKK